MSALDCETLVFFLPVQRVCELYMVLDGPPFSVPANAMRAKRAMLPWIERNVDELISFPCEIERANSIIFFETLRTCVQKMPTECANPNFGSVVPETVSRPLLRYCPDPESTAFVKGLYDVVGTMALRRSTVMEEYGLLISHFGTNVLTLNFGETMVRRAMAYIESMKPKARAFQRPEEEQTFKVTKQIQSPNLILFFIMRDEVFVKTELLQPHKLWRKLEKYATITDTHYEVKGLTHKRKTDGEEITVTLTNTNTRKKIVIENPLLYNAYNYVTKKTDEYDVEKANEDFKIARDTAAWTSFVDFCHKMAPAAIAGDSDISTKFWDTIGINTLDFMMDIMSSLFEKIVFNVLAGNMEENDGDDFYERNSKKGGAWFQSWFQDSLKKMEVIPRALIMIMRSPIIKIFFVFILYYVQERTCKSALKSEDAALRKDPTKNTVTLTWYDGLTGDLPTALITEFSRQMKTGIADCERMFMVILNEIQKNIYAWIQKLKNVEWAKGIDWVAEGLATVFPGAPVKMALSSMNFLFQFFKMALNVASPIHNIASLTIGVHGAAAALKTVRKLGASPGNSTSSFIVGVLKILSPTEFIKSCFENLVASYNRYFRRMMMMRGAKMMLFTVFSEFCRDKFDGNIEISYLSIEHAINNSSLQSVQQEMTQNLKVVEAGTVHMWTVVCCPTLEPVKPVELNNYIAALELALKTDIEEKTSMYEGGYVKNNNFTPICCVWGVVPQTFPIEVTTVTVDGNRLTLNGEFTLIVKGDAPSIIQKVKKGQFTELINFPLLCNEEYQPSKKANENEAKPHEVRNDGAKQSQDDARFEFGVSQSKNQACTTVKTLIEQVKGKLHEDKLHEDNHRAVHGAAWKVGDYYVLYSPLTSTGAENKSREAYRPEDNDIWVNVYSEIDQTKSVRSTFYILRIRNNRVQIVHEMNERVLQGEDALSRLYTSEINLYRVMNNPTEQNASIIRALFNSDLQRIELNQSAHLLWNIDGTKINGVVAADGRNTTVTAESLKYHRNESYELSQDGEKIWISNNNEENIIEIDSK
jgi:hypothetical protein